MCSDNPAVALDLSLDLAQLTDGEIARRMRHLMTLETFEALRLRHPGLSDVDIIDSVVRMAGLWALVSSSPAITQKQS